MKFFQFWLVFNWYFRLGCKCFKDQTYGLFYSKFILWCNYIQTIWIRWVIIWVERWVGPSFEIYCICFWGRWGWRFGRWWQWKNRGCRLRWIYIHKLTTFRINHYTGNTKVYKSIRTVDKPFYSHRRKKPSVFHTENVQLVESSSWRF